MLSASTDTTEHILKYCDNDYDDDDGFCSMAERQKAYSLIFSRDHCQRSSPSRISDTSQAGFQPALNLSLDFVE